MAKGKKTLKKLLIALPLLIAFILISNLCDKGILSWQIQKPIDTLNDATDGLIYPKQSNTKALSVHYIDVGQGDSILICCEGKNMIIDGGIPQETSTVENYLEDHAIKHLDYVIGTHPHDDHIGGLSGVIDKYGIGNVILPDVTTNTKSFERLLNSISKKKLDIIKAKAGNTYSLGGAKFTILAPLEKYNDLNNMSVVIRLTYKKNSFLFTGDASSESENDMLSANENLAADVLKVGHHGSSTATTKKFLDAVHPSYAVISVGKDNSYGLPDSEIIQRIQNSGIKLLRTDNNGTVVIYSDGQNITYKKER